MKTKQTNNGMNYAYFTVVFFSHKWLIGCLSLHAFPRKMRLKITIFLLNPTFIWTFHFLIHSCLYYFESHANTQKIFIFWTQKNILRVWRSRQKGQTNKKYWTDLNTSSRKWTECFDSMVVQRGQNMILRIPLVIILVNT